MLGVTKIAKLKKNQKLNEKKISYKSRQFMVEIIEARFSKMKFYLHKLVS